MKFTVEWKTKDLKIKHAWVIDAKAKSEFPLCEPARRLPYINMLNREEYSGGKVCKSCLKKIANFRSKFPEIRIYG